MKMDIDSVMRAMDRYFGWILVFYAACVVCFALTVGYLVKLALTNS